MEDWKEYTVQELIDLDMLEEPLDGNHGEKHPKSTDYVESGVPFVMANNLKGGSVDLTNCYFITEEQANSLDKGFAKPGDVLLTHKATLGRTAIVPDLYPIIVLTPQVTYYRCKKGINNIYLKYYFDSPNFQKLFENWAGSGSTRLYLGIKAQRRLPIKLPPLPTQQKIAAVLSALDDKIELNRQINANLEQQAQAIFKNWFVDFEPFGGQMPAGWRVGKLSEIADYLNGLAMQKFRPLEDEESLPVLKIKELRQGSFDEGYELCSPSLIKTDYVVDDGDVIFSWSGSLLVDIWCGGKGGLNQHLFKVTSDKYNKWFYYMWTKHHLERFVFLAQDKATTMGHIKREELDKAEVVIPDSKTYEKLNSTFSPIIETIINNRVESRKFAEVRDTLLPKLMSGEIDVSSVKV